MSYTNIPPSRTYQQPRSVPAPSVSDHAESAHDLPTSSTPWPVHASLLPNVTNSPPGEVIELHEVTSTAAERTPALWEVADPWGTPPPGSGWAEPEEPAVWGSPAPATAWIPPEPQPLRGIGVIRVDTPVVPGEMSTSPFALRFTGYSIATTDGTEGDTWESADEFVISWPSSMADAATWPEVPSPWHLNMMALPFWTRDAYAELKRVFAFFGGAHPMEDAEWLQNRWNRLTDKLHEVTLGPNGDPDHGFELTMYFWREDLP
ncbi:hypothetical protein L227DRAFT_568827, partial [Lentinus tigrinus ALCF2SS1-6]